MSLGDTNDIELDIERGGWNGGYIILFLGPNMPLKLCA